ncbi:phosphoric ester hydrolase-like protein [Pseudovirgaria hyperparasitica]|uniref:Phosphoric ester hydrolase-like protein n=1 Tax=Pseudovirgaria hyperparasitica TaxID=470096 RepID=A0A6A6WI95_9PEZI|nr:phosphoric ester hydrolase-like protein [Pseudovirgaria hyperparasitica]KAF2761377.1 phosphoric ester hydrolase-like protein [Pseudovirgaria hyperparasitica]
MHSAIVLYPSFKAPLPFERPSLVYLLLTCPVRLILYTIYHIQNSLRATLSPDTQPIRIVCISDTHDLQITDLPAGDILIHAGDLTNDGSTQSLQTQISWIASLPYHHKIVIAGNHDTYLDPRTRPSLSSAQRSASLDWKGIRYLQHSSTTITIKSASSLSRSLRIYGAPQIPACGPRESFAFQYEPRLDAWSGTVPSDTDVLVTHSPPQHHRDISLPEGLGCRYLLREVARVRPMLHVFGHVHWGAGMEMCWWDEAQRAYERGMEREIGWTRGLLDFGLWIEVVRVLAYGVTAVLWGQVWGGAEGRATKMVNSGVVKGSTGTLSGRVSVVDI